MTSRELFERSYVFHPTANHIVSVLKRLHGLGFGKNRGVFLTGVPGVGKTELSRFFLDSLPRPEVVDCEPLPYVYCQLSDNIPPNQILEELLDTLGCVFPKGTSANRKKSTYSMIESRHVHWVVFDEFQRLLSQSTNTFHKPAVNFINSFIDAIQRPVMLICEPVGLKIRENSGQTEGRFPRVNTLNEMSVTTEKSLQYYIFFLEEFQIQMPWKSIPLNTKDMAYRLFAATGGNNRKLKSLIINASCFPEDANEKLTRDHYSKSFVDLAGQVNLDWNPFDVRLDKLMKYLGI